MIRALLVCLIWSSSVFAADARTLETRALWQWLARPDPVPALGGQWNGGVKSFGWLEQAEIMGRSPLIYGIEYYDYGPIERRLDARRDGERLIKEKFGAGGVSTVNDHMPNFVTGGNSWDRGGDALAALLPGCAAHRDYVAYLNRMASFFEQQVVNGISVPILFRPFHEMNGDWFWWGDSKGGAQFVALWRFTWEYMQKTHGLRNLLWVWSPNIRSGWGREDFERFWPGREYVDVVALDGYDNRAEPDFASATFRSSYRAVAAIASGSKLPLAFSEVGFGQGGQRISGFWVTHFLPVLKREYPALSYVLIWNYAHGPRAGTPAADSFRTLAEEHTWVLQGDVRGSDIYGPGFSRAQQR